MGVVVATSSSSVESLYTVVLRSQLVAAVELLDIVVHVHAPASTKTREHVRYLP